MSDWKSRVKDAFRPYADYKPGRYISQFPELERIADKQPYDLTSDDVWVLLSKPMYVKDWSLLARYLPEIMIRYCDRTIEELASQLYAALLGWSGRLTEEQYASLNEAVLAHWETTIAEHTPPRKLAIRAEESCFLVLWLRETAPLESSLRDLARKFYRQEVEFVWDETWDSVTWTPLIYKLRASPIETLFEQATLGAMVGLGLQADEARDFRVMEVLQRTGLLGQE